MIHEGTHYERISHAVYKYRALVDIYTQTRIKGYDISTNYIRLMPCGNLIAKKGYACDGASGPTIDDNSNMHGAFAHDGLFQLLRLGKLGYQKDEFDKNRKLADKTLIDQCKKDGMPWIRRQLWYYSLRLFGKKNALPRGDLYN